MKIAYIAPIDYLHLIPEDETFHLTLAHLLKSKTYVDFYNKKAERGDTIILDNSAFEFGKPVPAEKILDLIEKSGFKPTHLVAPDYPGEPGSKTVESTKQFIQLLERRGLRDKYKIMAVPQSKENNITDWFNCYAQLTNLEIDMIGMSILGIPNAFKGATGTSDIATNRIYASMFLVKNNLYNPNVWHHYLGLGSPRELVIQQMIGLADSNDSSSAFWHGILGKRYDDSAGGLREGKSKISVAFDVPYNKEYEDDIKYNIEQIKQWTKD